KERSRRTSLPNPPASLILSFAAHPQQPTHKAKNQERIMSNSANATPRITRRRVLQGAAGLAVVGALRAGTRPSRAEETVAKKKRLKQSIVRWCFEKHWNIELLCQQAKRLGCPSVELVDPKDWPTLQKHGLVCAIAGSHTFEKGMNNPKYHEMCIAK